MTFENSLEFALKMDQNDPLSAYRSRFFIPQHNGKDSIYLTGNSLGLQPRSVLDKIKQELDDQGEKTGNYLVKFKLKALVKPKKSEPFAQSPVLLDEDGNRLTALIAGGSKMKVAYEPFAYSALGGGVSLRVKKVRLAKDGLVEYVATDSKLDWGEDCIDKPKEEVVEAVEEVAVAVDGDLDDEEF
jgi:hypothetical protein